MMRRSGRILGDTIEVVKPRWMAAVGEDTLGCCRACRSPCRLLRRPAAGKEKEEAMAAPET